MSTTPLAEHEGEATSRSRRGRKIVALVAGAILGIAVVVLVALLSISTASAGATSVLIGTLGSERLAALALVFALGALAVGLCVIPVPRVWLLLLVPVRLAAVAATGLAGLAGVLISSATVVPLVAAGCETGYVVEEESFLLAGRGTLYRTDGVLVTDVGHFGADDGYTPFADGAYTVVDNGDSLKIWYSAVFDVSAAPVSTDREADFVLTKITDRALSCGISTGARAPIPAAPPLPTYDADEAQAGLRNMVAASLDAAVDPVRDPAGQLLDPDELPVVSTACDGGGTQSGLEIAFATADNGSSLTRILQVWDEAGYSADRAMHDDIRYSEALPVKTMSIRDSTTIDGLIYLRVTSQCSVL